MAEVMPMPNNANVAPIQFVPVMTFDTSSGTYVGPILMPMQMIMPQPGRTPQEGGGHHGDFPKADCKCGCQNIIEKTTSTLLQALLEGKGNKGSKERRAMRGRSFDPKKGTNTSAPTAEAPLQLQKLLELGKEREPQSELKKPWEPGAVVRGSSSSSVGSASVATASGASTSTTSPAGSQASDEGLPMRPGLMPHPTVVSAAAGGIFLKGGGSEDDGGEDPSKSEVPFRKAPDALAKPSPNFTTVMLKHIPSQCSRDQLLHELNQEFKGRFDFLYLPMDFAARKNQGYCFINFVSRAACARFCRAFDGKSVNSCFQGFTGSRLLMVKEAKVQGFEANVMRIRQSSVMTELLQNREWMPLTLDVEGDVMPFPDPAENLSLWRLRANASKKANRVGSSR